MKHRQDLLGLEKINKTKIIVKQISTPSLNNLKINRIDFMYEHIFLLCWFQWLSIAVTECSKT